MTVKAPHIIRSQKLDVQYFGTANGGELQQTVNEFYRLLMNRLEEVLDRFDMQDRVVLLDSIVIDANDITNYELEQGVTDKIVQQFEKLIRDKITAAAQANNTETPVTLKIKFIKIWAFYLKHGFLPWWGQLKRGYGVDVTAGSIQTSIEELLKQPFTETEKQIFTAVLAHSVALSRLVTQLTEQQFWAFLASYSQAEEAIITSLQADIEVILSTSSHPFKNDVKTAIKLALLKAAGTTTSLPGLYQSWAMEIFGVMNIEHVVINELVMLRNLKTSTLVKMFSARFDKLDEPRKAQAKVSSSDSADIDKNVSMEEISKASEEYRKEIKQAISEKEGIYISNAGLVIVAQYLNRFFTQLGIVDDGKITDLPKAVTLLHYVATGAEEFEEYEVVLPKVLCGLQPEYLVLPVALDEADIIETNALLEAIIEHWSVLKNTSVEGLKGSFLQREGKLSFDNNIWSLKVQPQSYDLLLQHLPWNFGMIKLPWMPSLMKTEWI